MVGIFMSMGVNKPNPYIDDIFHGKGSNFDNHLDILDEIFQHLKDAGMQVNLTKSTLCAKEVEFLGFLLKEMGYQPTKKRIEAILKIAPPKNVKKVREFLDTTLSIPYSQPSWNPGTHHTSHKERCTIYLGGGS
jgi:hypothetical protein